MVNDVQEILLSEEKIALKIKELGKAISEEYAGKDLLVIGVLKGSVIFVSDLVRNISIPCEMDFMSVSSYGESSESSGVVRILKDLDNSSIGNNIILTTYHSSKGLEAKVVILTTIDSIYTGDDCDDHFKRKVAYVGITRASEKLFIFSKYGEEGPLLNELKELSMVNV